MSIKGVGVDLVRVARIEKAVRRWGDKFLDRVFTGDELEYCLSRRRRYEHLAGRFAAKEAVIKALGKRVSWKSVEILPGNHGVPEVDFPREGIEGVSPEAKVNLSITHVEELAAAFAVLSN